MFMEKKWVVRIYLFTGIGIFLWLSLIILAPYLKIKASPGIELIYSAFAPICHQIESRCFFLWGNALPVCTRCLGIYSGFLGGAWSYPFFRGFRVLRVPSINTFLFFSAPIVIDTIGIFFNIWATGAWMRFFIGLAWGVILPYYFITGLADFFIQRRLKS